MKRTRNITGTFLVGEVRTTYDHLVAVLGEPHFLDGDKTTVEWAFEHDGVVFTVYDWKTCVTPMGEYDWHIGGRGQTALAVARACIGRS